MPVSFIISMSAARADSKDVFSGEKGTGREEFQMVLVQFLKGQ